MSKDTSGYTSFDLLNQQAAIASGGQSPVRESSRFSSALNSINQFLSTATHTIVTVDGVINKDNQGPAQRSLYPAMHVAPTGKGSSVIKYLAIAGVAIGGGVIAVKTLKK